MSHQGGALVLVVALVDLGPREGQAAVLRRRHRDLAREAARAHEGRVAHVHDEVAAAAASGQLDGGVRLVDEVAVGRVLPDFDDARPLVADGVALVAVVEVGEPRDEEAALPPAGERHPGQEELAARGGDDDGVARPLQAVGRRRQRRRRVVLGTAGHEAAHPREASVVGGRHPDPGLGRGRALGPGRRRLWWRPAGQAGEEARQAVPGLGQQGSRVVRQRRLGRAQVHGAEVVVEGEDVVLVDGGHRDGRLVLALPEQIPSQIVVAPGGCPGGVLLDTGRTLTFSPTFTCWAKAAGCGEALRQRARTNATFGDLCKSFLLVFGERPRMQETRRLAASSGPRAGANPLQQYGCPVRAWVGMLLACRHIVNMYY